MFNKLVGKTIQTINKRQHSKTDDQGYLDIIFTDGTEVCIVGGYVEEWTNKSLNEYPTTITLKEYNYEDRIWKNIKYDNEKSR